MRKLNRKTTFIIGAGASHEFGLPTGLTLKKKIAEKLNIVFKYNAGRGQYVSGDMDIMKLFDNVSRYDSSYTESGDDFQRQGWTIRDNMLPSPSIDNFLHTHKNKKSLVLAGKIAIAKSIMEAEKASILFPRRDNYNDVVVYDEVVSNTWLGKFFTILIAEKNFEAFLEALSNITFISFNYDRCIQEFFCRAAQQYFVLTNEQIKVLIDTLEIIYTYGTIGKYEWNNGNSNFGEAKIYDVPLAL